VQKTVGSVVTNYVYDAGGQLGAEYSTAAPAASGTEFLMADALGSTRLVLDVTGAVKERTDYLPFGEEIATPIGGRAAPYTAGLYRSNPDIEAQKFTGKERDAETGLDFFGARYTSAPEGRFSSPDPSPAGIAIQDPQSWNLYAYVRDRPTRFVDGNGNWATDIHAEIVTYALQGYVSAGELNELRKMQYVMDADQSDQNTHSMANRNQSSQDALTGTWRFVSAQMAMIPGNIGLGGTLTTAGLDELGSALHTVQDCTSPMHTDSNFNPMEWRGGYWPPWKLGPGAAHVLGESNPASDWSRIGLAVRLTMAAFLQSGAACESGRRCLTEANFETEFRRNVEDYVSHHYAFLPSVGGSPAIEDAARQCALGNPAACFR